MKFRPFLLSLLLAATAPAAAQAERAWFEAGPTPLRYEISVTPNVDASTFTGETVITIQSDAPLTSVTMNALDLTVQRASIDNATARAEVSAEAQTLTLTPRRPLAAGRHTIRIAYAGKIYDEAYGLFRVEYQDDGQTKRAVATQFEPGDARRFAPMWDQPNRRAVFSLTVTARADQLAVGNMPVARTVHLSGNRARTTFADTPSMPSYLLFLAVGDFERVTRNVNGIELGVVMRRGEGHRAQDALDAGEQSLNYYADYFGAPYPLPKLDMIGVPGAGGFGAMENWGAILYFDQYLLVDENSSVAERQNVFGTVAHEIAHQWFGDLVTMNWWDDLWLNEGFASWMAAKATEHVHPDWHPWMAQLTDGTATAMSLDAREGTHPIVQEINTIDDANLAFDTITYEKGLAVIRMIEAYVGEEDFRTGVRNYINAHRYGNARTEDLWASVQAASGQPVLALARSFTTQPGFPLLTATGGSCRRGGHTDVSISQRRFAMDETARTDERWSVPVVAAHVSGGDPVRTLLEPNSPSTVTLACGAYLVNAGQSGFFRVKYDTTNFNLLTQRFSELESVDQLGLLLDYYAFGRSGDASFANYLDLVDAIPADADPVIVMDTASSFSAFADYTRDRPSAEAVRAYGRRVLDPYFARVGWDPRPGDDANLTNMRATLITTLGGLGDEGVIAEARRRVRASQSDPSTLPTEIRSAARGVYAANATEADFETLLAQARAETEFVEQRRLWRSLASVNNDALAQRLLHMTLGDEIPRQIRPQVISVVASSHPRMAWDFLAANRPAVEAMLDPLQRLEYPTNIAALSGDPAMVEELGRYAQNFPEGSARDAVAGAQAQIRLRAETIRERMPAVEAWIAQHQPTTQRRR
ncbi:MAG: M1 family metallopeptidase [Alphaproteobacteria bacterium]|nr:M1 family metallopeptidase [Alphaproteobacteria bacterium]